MSCTEKSKVVIPARVGMTVLFIFCVTSIIKIHMQKALPPFIQKGVGNIKMNHANA
jgi:hypothetical protein